MISSLSDRSGTIEVAQQFQSVFQASIIDDISINKINDCNRDMYSLDTRKK